MPPNLRRLFLLPALALAALLSSGCQHGGAQKPGSQAMDASVRPAVAALDKVTADDRKARVSNVSYDLIVDIASSDEEFVGELAIRFDLSDASSDLTLDFSGGGVISIAINGDTVLADYNGYFITLPAELLQSGANTVHIAYVSPFGHDGTGLHRFEDPEDGLTYLHSYLWPYYANRLLPCFDQPSLKASFAMRVRAPQDWTVVSTSPATARPNGDGTQLWTFDRTPLIATYMFSLHAGHYRIWSDDSGEVPLRLMARQSLAEYVAVDEWFEITQRGMSFFSDYFDIPYPFRKYDQLIVPEFNISGMENAAAVTFAEHFVQHQASDRAQREDRADTVLHELAHMWFGDLVTHDWWNGMWLNESFATQMAALALVATTEFTDQWHGYFTESKKAAYFRDSRITTHPIEMPVASTDEFTVLFDAITYQKGGSVLKQLQHRVGAENYRLGVSAYLKEHAWGNTELADFVRHQGKAAGTDLGDWSGEWLMRAGFNTLAVEATCSDDDLESLAIRQSASPDQPYLRTHSVDVALYNFDADGTLVVTAALPVTVKGRSTAVDTAAGQPCPVIVNPNHNDWTFARLGLDDRDVSLLENHLGDFADPLTRSMFLAAMMDEAMAGRMPVANYVQLALRLAETEKNVRVLQQISASLRDSLHLMQRLGPETDNVLPQLLRAVESLSLRRAHFAETGDLKQLWFNLFLDVVSSKAGLGTARALLDGEAEVAGIDISPEVRWRLLIILSRHDAEGADELLAAESRRDPSDLGQRNLLSARAAKPDLANKQYWVAELQSPQQLNSFAKQRAVIDALFPPTQTGLQLELLGMLLEPLPTMSREADAYFLKSYTERLFTPMCKPESNALFRSALDRHAEQLNPTALRFLREAHQLDVECRALRERNLHRP